LTEELATQLASELAANLAATHRRVRDLDVADDEKALASRRLLAISEAAKHDVATASRRLQTFVRDLDAGRIAVSKRPDGA
jgi:hypothetical protein